MNRYGYASPTHSPSQLVWANAFGWGQQAQFRMHCIPVAQGHQQHSSVGCDPMPSTSEQMKQRMDRYLLSCSRNRNVKNLYEISYDIDETEHEYPAATGERIRNTNIVHKPDKKIREVNKYTGNKNVHNIHSATNSVTKLLEREEKDERTKQIRRYQYSEQGTQADEVVAVNSHFNVLRDKHVPEAKRAVFKPLNLRITIQNESNVVFEGGRTVEITKDDFTLYQKHVFNSFPIFKLPPGEKKDLSKFVSGPVWALSFPIRCTQHLWDLVQLNKCTEYGIMAQAYSKDPVRCIEEKSGEFKSPVTVNAKEILEARKVECIKRAVEEKKRRSEKWEEKKKRKSEQLEEKRKQIERANFKAWQYQPSEKEKETGGIERLGGNLGFSNSATFHGASGWADTSGVSPGYECPPSPAFSVLTEYEGYVTEGRNIRHMRFDKEKN